MGIFKKELWWLYEGCSIVVRVRRRLKQSVHWGMACGLNGVLATNANEAVPVVAMRSVACMHA